VIWLLTAAILWLEGGILGSENEGLGRTTCVCEILLQTRENCY